MSLPQPTEPQLFLTQEHHLVTFSTLLLLSLLVHRVFKVLKAFKAFKAFRELRESKAFKVSVTPRMRRVPRQLLVKQHSLLLIVLETLTFSSTVLV